MHCVYGIYFSLSDEYEYVIDHICASLINNNNMFWHMKS